jgi:hypothetical protein
MAAEERVFRPAALRRLAEADERGELPAFTPPHEWLAVGAIGLLLAAALAWGFLGSVPLGPTAGTIAAPCETGPVDDPAPQRVAPIRLLVPGGAGAR